MAEGTLTYPQNSTLKCKEIDSKPTHICFWSKMPTYVIDAFLPKETYSDAIILCTTQGGHKINGVMHIVMSK